MAVLRIRIVVQLITRMNYQSVKDILCNWGMEELVPVFEGKFINNTIIVTRSLDFPGHGLVLSGVRF